MNDQEYREYSLSLLQRFCERLSKEAGNASPDDPIRQLLTGFESIAKGDNVYEKGPDLVSTLFASCPQLAPLFPRELLWFLGGECLHFMPDDELLSYQQLDEIRHQAAARGEVLDYQQERAKLLKLQ
ncbi:MAG: PA2817 family protein [Pseudomonadota bacterium]